MAVTKAFYIEHLINGEYIEYEYEVEADSYEPYVPARISGPPEDCYPAEGGTADVMSNDIRRRRTDDPKAPWERAPFSVFLEGIVDQHHFKDDPKDKWCGKTALDKADEYIQDEMYEACEEDARGRYEDAMEAKAEAQREARMERDYDYGD
jgi:hypothetical protein